MFRLRWSRFQPLAKIISDFDLGAEYLWFDERRTIINRF